MLVKLLFIVHTSNANKKLKRVIEIKMLIFVHCAFTFALLLYITIASY